MPTYQYACTACGEQLEAVQKFSDDPLTECPACQGKLRKVFSAVGIVFKGSGFYRTDSRSSSSSTTTSTTTTPSKSADSAGSGSSNGSGDSGKKETASTSTSTSTSSSGSTAAA
ncbi:FmdB family zinc ribbon protein [Microbispora triticiradicis]|uniref:FmdB family transcriptional regulator n=2 Tax=Microbispora TaxID=2005 RepID=A0ABY3M4L9_9ACTN|nr:MULTISPECIES: FmdB family zinc ribbon protein [Microbispora]TLP57019.1 FmdB family transcriptional regulator [Microbispora fusca]TYB66975.1 FmdB family transcriptional regulator [Microbispora tritici]GLW26460.1 FmdB family transcriptional regulator [Microbispora amethystogenes]